jgi:hypothetical protein
MLVPVKTEREQCINNGMKIAGVELKRTCGGYITSKSET